MPKPVSIIVDQTECPFFNYEGAPYYFDFNSFEQLATTFASLQDTPEEKTIVTVVFDNNEALNCNLFLGKDSNYSFADMIGNIRYGFTQEKCPDQELEDLINSIKFTLH